MNALINMFIIITLNFLCGFLLMNNLYIPPTNHLHKIRLLVWFGLGNLAFKEAHSDIVSWGTDDRRNNPISGQYRWLLSSILLAEVVISIKFRKDSGNIVDAETPVYIWLPWTVTIVSLYSFYFYLRLKKGHTTKYPAIQPTKTKNKKE